VEQVGFHELKIHHGKDSVQLGVAQWELEFLCTLANDLHDLEGPSRLSKNLGDRHVVHMLTRLPRLGHLC
jgi:hypothetical protein